MIPLDVFLGNRTSWKILSVFAESPGKGISRKEISYLTRSGNKVISKSLLLFFRAGIIDVKKIGKSSIYNLNLANKQVERIIELLHEEKKENNNLDFTIFLLIKDFVYDITNAELENLSEIYLFGSHAKRTAGKESDVDLAIITKKKNPSFELTITDLCEKTKNRFNKKIQTHYFTEDEFKDKKRKLVVEILIDGVKVF